MLKGGKISKISKWCSILNNDITSINILVNSVKVRQEQEALYSFNTKGFEEPCPCSDSNATFVSFVFAFCFVTAWEIQN